jgi:CheY-like chemotaxis protein
VGGIGGENVARDDHARSALANCQVLLVEDEVIIALDLQQILKDAGCRPLRATNVTEALAVIATTKIDAAVLDLNLGKETPFPIADALSAKQIPFMFITGYSIDRVPKQFRRRLVLNKPFQPQELLSMLDRAITPVEARVLGFDT